MKNPTLQQVEAMAGLDGNQDFKEFLAWLRGANEALSETMQENDTQARWNEGERRVLREILKAAGTARDDRDRIASSRTRQQTGH